VRRRCTVRAALRFAAVTLAGVLVVTMYVAGAIAVLQRLEFDVLSWGGVGLVFTTALLLGIPAQVLVAAVAVENLLKGLS